MFTIQQSVTIARPVEVVFAFLADPANIPRWRPDVLETRSGGPLQAGSEFDEVLNFGGRKTQTFRVTVFEANKTLEGCADVRPSSRPSNSASSRACTAPASMESPPSPTWFPSPAPPSTVYRTLQRLSVARR
jgi:uncharacterized protein YndB with AHSA1/START domain